MRLLKKEFARLGSAAVKIAQMLVVILAAGLLASSANGNRVSSSHSSYCNVRKYCLSMVVHIVPATVLLCKSRALSAPL